MGKVLKASRGQNLDTISSLNIDGCGYIDVSQEELAQCVELLEVSANENLLNMHPFGVLPKLKSLSLACNMIPEIPIIQEKFLLLEVYQNGKEIEFMALDIRPFVQSA